MACGGDKMNSFIVNVLDTRNHTWQGTVTWVESQRTESFRSAIELMELINSVVGTEEIAFNKETENPKQ